MKRACVFCGAATPKDESFMNLGKEITTGLVNKGYGIVYGGSDRGLMRVVAETALSMQGDVTGVWCDAVAEQEQPLEGLTKLIISNKENFGDRKQKFLDLSDIFIILPGGYGTFDEFLEVITTRMLETHDKEVYLVNYQGYWDDMLKQSKKMAEAGFLFNYERLFITVTNAEELLNKL